MIKKGPIQISNAEFSRIREQLKASSVDYNGKPSEFYVYQETTQGVLIPRYQLGMSAYQAARDEQDPRVNPNFPEFKGPLWDLQKPGVAQAINALAREHGVFINARPGSGKTVAALYIATQLRPHKVLVMVDQDNLAQQWCERIKEFVPEAKVSFIMPLASQRALYRKFQGGLIPKDRFDLRGDFIICMAQTYMHHPQPIKVGLVIVDEAHVFSAPCFSQTIFNVNFKFSLALSATTERKDGNEWVFRKMLGTTTVVMKGKTEKARAMFFGVNTEFLKWSDPMPNNKHMWFKCIWCRVHEKMTCRYECQKCDVSIRMKTSNPEVLATNCASLYKYQDYNEAAVERMLCDDPTYNAWITETLGTFLEAGRDIFVFSRRRAHLEHLHLLLSLLYGDVSGLYLGAATNAAARAANAEGLQKRITLATFGKAGKGLDVQRKDGALYAGPVGKHTVEQATGRIERSMSGKMKPVVVHPIIPFPTHIARMHGCLGFYRRNKYGTQIEEDLYRKSNRKRR